MTRPTSLFAAIAAGTLLLSGCTGTGAVETGSTSAGTVTVSTLKGEVEVPANVENVVALTSPAADVSAELGLTPVAVEESSTGLQPWQQDSLAAVADPALGDDEGALDIEKIASYEPDVIFAGPWQVADDSVHRQLSEIAPVVVPDSEAVNPDWDDTLTTVGQALGKSDDAERILTETQESLAAVGEETGAQGRTYQLVSPRPDGIYFGNAAPLELFGLEPGRHQTPEEVNRFALSAENLDELDADHLFIWAMDEESRKSLEDNPTFDSLPAVQSGRAQFIDTDVATAINAASPASMRWLVDEGGFRDVLAK